MSWSNDMHPSPWTPWALRQTTLLAFTALFAALAIALGSVYKYSNDHQGIATPETRLRYLWTYVPSTLFIAISGIWVSVLYNTQTLAPFLALQNGPTEGSKSLFLDYISPNRYASFLRSWRNGHWTVALAIVGASCLDFNIVLSTGLFRVYNFTDFDPHHTFPLAAKLNFTGYGPNVDSAISNAYAISGYNLTFPPGSAMDFAYTHVAANAIPIDATAHFIVDAVQVNVSCEAANASWTFGLYNRTDINSTPIPGAIIEAVSPTCQLTYPISFSTSALNHTYFFDMGITGCGAHPDDPKKSTTELFFVANSMEVTDMEINTAINNSANSPWQDFGLTVLGRPPAQFQPVGNKTLSSKANVIFCRIIPYARNASLIISQSSTNVSLLDIGDAKDIQIFNGTTPEFNYSLQSYIQYGAVERLEWAGDYIGGVDMLNTPEEDQTPQLPILPSDMGLDKWGGNHILFFDFMNLTNPRETVADMIDAKYLTESAISPLQLIASQLLANDFLMPTKENYTGTLSHNEKRLVVSTPAFGLILGFLTLQVAICLALCFLPRSEMVKCPGSITSKATILARSPDIIALARQNFASRRERELVRPDKFKAAISYDGGRPKFSIERYGNDDMTNNVNALEMITKWWHPWSTSLLFRILSVLIPCVGIGLLEILFRISQKRQGIADVTFNSYAQYAWVYIPVVVIFLMNLVFESTSYTNRIMEPYEAMRQKSLPAAQSLSVDFVNRVTLSALWLAIRLRNIATAVSIIATLLGTALPIAASGLYKIQGAQTSHAVTFQQTTSFDPNISLTTKNPSHDHYPVPGLIFYSNLSFPRWTYQKYALPQISFSNTTAPDFRPDPSTQSSLSIDLPAVYGVANCSPIPTENFNYTTFVSHDSNDTYPYYSYPYFNVAVEADMGPNCPPLKHVFGNYSFPEPSQSRPQPFIAAQWIGQQLGKVNLSDSEIYASTYHGSGPRGCYSNYVAFVSGTHYTGAYNMTTLGDPVVDNTTSSTVTIETQIWLQCQPHVKKTTLDVEFSLPGYDISPTRPPMVKSGTETFFSEAELVNNQGWAYYLPWFDADAVYSFPSPTKPCFDFDQFFGVVFDSPGAILPSDLLGLRDAAIKRLQDRVDEVYGIIVAQVYDGKNRHPTLPADAQLRFNGTVTSPGSERVRQDELSTRIIQVLLALMLICAITSMTLVNGRQLLPYNPCTIAGVASLLAHSSILSEEIIPPGSEFHDEKALRRLGVLEHGLYSLGYWGSGKSRWFGIDMGRAEKDKSASFLLRNTASRDGTASPVSSTLRSIDDAEMTLRQTDRSAGGTVKPKQEGWIVQETVIHVPRM